MQKTPKLDASGFFVVFSELVRNGEKPALVHTFWSVIMTSAAVL